MNKFKYFIVLLVLGVSACTEPIDLDLNTDENIRLVVDAQLTTEAKAHLVYLTTTRDFFTPGQPIPAIDAVVTLDDGNSTENLVELEPGSYFTAEDFAGEVGKTYTLTIAYEGVTYTAVSEILPVASLDEVRAELADPDDDFFDDEEEFDEEGNPLVFYDIFGVSEEPPTPGNHYLWFVNVNGERRLADYVDWFFVNDDLVNGQHIDVDFYTLDAEPGDVVELQQMSITPGAYDFLLDVTFEVFRGGLFDGAPANVSTNIDNGALGYFITSDVSSNSALIPE